MCAPAGSAIRPADVGDPPSDVAGRRPRDRRRPAARLAVAAEALRRDGHRLTPRSGCWRPATRCASAARLVPGMRIPSRTRSRDRRRRDDVDARRGPDTGGSRTTSRSRRARRAPGCTTRCAGPARSARSAGSRTALLRRRCSARPRRPGRGARERRPTARRRARRRRHRARPRRPGARRAAHAPAALAGRWELPGGRVEPGRTSRRRGPGVPRGARHRGRARAGSAPTCRSTRVSCASTARDRAGGPASRGRSSTRPCAGSTRPRCPPWTGSTPTAPWSPTWCGCSRVRGRDDCAARLGWFARTRRDFEPLPLAGAQ